MPASSWRGIASLKLFGPKLPCSGGNAMIFSTKLLNVTAYASTLSADNDL